MRRRSSSATGAATRLWSMSWSPRSSPLLDGKAIREDVRDHQDLLPALHALRRGGQ